MNKSDLKKAWDSRWKKQFDLARAPRDTIMTPSCDKVLSATTFLRSLSAHALIPAKNKVQEPRANNGMDSVRQYRIKTYTPAVTNVEE